jgi:hypothetical protein
MAELLTALKASGLQFRHRANPNDDRNVGAQMGDERQESPMPDHWVVRAAFEGDPDADWLMRLEDELDQQRLDASVSAQPLDETWTVTVSSSSRKAPVAIEKVLGQIDPFVRRQPVAVEAVRPDEYERRAFRSTLPVLLGASEVAELLGVSRQRVHQLRSHTQFPAPIVEVAMGPLWDERAVQKFGREWARKPGRPGGTLTA